METYKGSVDSLKEFWEDMGRRGSFERGYNIRFEGISKIVDKIAESISDKSILDIGCGPGIIESLLPQDARVVGLDFSIAMLKSAKNRIQQLIRGNIFNLPFNDEAFEVAICLFVASDYSFKQGIFSEASRILRSNGLFVFADYSPEDEHWILKKRIRPLLGEGCNIFIEGVESLSDKLEISSFEVQRTEIVRFKTKFELGRYIKSEKELEQIKTVDLKLWKYLQDRTNVRRIGREFILLTSRKIGS